MDFGIRINRNLHLAISLEEGGVVTVIGTETNDEGDVTTFTGHVEWDD